VQRPPIPEIISVTSKLHLRHFWYTHNHDVHIWQIPLVKRMAGHTYPHRNFICFMHRIEDYGSKGKHQNQGDKNEGNNASRQNNRVPFAPVQDQSVENTLGFRRTYLKCASQSRIPVSTWTPFGRFSVTVDAAWARLGIRLSLVISYLVQI